MRSVCASAIASAILIAQPANAQDDSEAPAAAFGKGQDDTGSIASAATAVGSLTASF